jgi:hypothetical protein
VKCEDINAGWGRVASICLATALSIASNPSLALEPDHIRAGNIELVPSVEMRVVRRSNVYLTEGETTAEEGNVIGAAPQSGTAILLHPSLSFGIEGEDTTVQFNLDMDAARYLEEEHQNLNRYDDVELGLDFRTLNRSIVGLKLNERFHRTGRETEATYATSAYITHLMNNTGGRLSFRPGSSLSIDVGGDFSYDKYDVSADATADGSPSLNSRVGYGPGIDLKWSFFPKTAIVASYSQHWFTWENNLVDTKGDGLSESEFGDSLGIPNGSEWKATVGLRGRLTEKIVLGLIGGVGQMDYDENSVQGQNGEGNAAEQGFDRDLTGLSEGILGIVELGYKPIEGQSLTLGYRKDFQDVYFTNFVDFHNVFVRYEGMFADRFGAKASGGYRFEQYLGEVSRDDHVLNAGVDLSVRVTRYFEVAGGVSWKERGSADGLHSDIEYDDVTMSLGLTGSY